MLVTRAPLNLGLFVFTKLVKSNIVFNVQMSSSVCKKFSQQLFHISCTNGFFGLSLLGPPSGPNPDPELYILCIPMGNRYLEFTILCNFNAFVK